MSLTTDDDVSWMADAACRTLTPQQVDRWFFPNRGESVRPAKAICADCPVRQQCLDYAMDRPERYGIWGGLSERERRQLRAQRRWRWRRCDCCGLRFRQTHLGATRDYCSDDCRRQAHNAERAAANRRYMADHRNRETG